MIPRIERLNETKLIGQRKKMSFGNNQTKALWQGFMPRRNEIRNIEGQELYSVEIYGDTRFFENFDPPKEYEKWAAVKVKDHNHIPDGMLALTIPEGDYAVFQYKGKPSEAYRSYQYIFKNWFPKSKYDLDDRPHFALMDDRYRGEDPSSEEEFWIPITRKQML